MRFRSPRAVARVALLTAIASLPATQYAGSAWAGEREDKAVITAVDKVLANDVPNANFGEARKKLRALGFNGDFAAMDFDDKVKFEGVAFTCKHDTYNNKPKEKWDLKDWGGEVEQASQDKLRRLKGNSK